MCSWQVMPITKARLKNEPCAVKESIAVVLEVAGLNLFNTPGTIKSVDVPGVGKVDESAAATRPFSEEVAELFKIKDGKIHDVVAVMVTLPFGATSGWSQ